MNREKFLWPLTAGHHEALVTAREIRRSMESIRGDGAMGAWASLTEETKSYIQNRLEPHFKAEDEILTLFDRHAGADNQASRRLRAEHQSLMALLNQNSMESLLLFAEGLENHIRFEEDNLFPLLQLQLNSLEKKQVAEILEKKLLPAIPRGHLEKK